MRNPLIAIRMKASGLKCDAEGCDYRESGIPLTPANIAATIGKPCPKCGSNLLTEADASALLFMRRVIVGVNIVSFPFMVLALPFTILSIVRNRVPTYRAEMNGAGTIRFTKKPPPISAAGK